jgi:hypothetical protein
VRLRIVTAFAIAVVAFYVGVAVDAARAPATIEIPDTLSRTTIGEGGSVRIGDVTVATVQSQPDRLQTVATIGAVVAAAFLLARLAVVVVRQVRARRAA